jgi:hypothetical protein
MPLNFGGLGFSFVGKDDGASAVSDVVADSLDSVWNKLGRVGTAASKMGARLRGGVGKLNATVGRAMGGVSLALTSAIESAQNPKLDAPFDQMYAQFNKTFRAMTVGMNMSEKEAQRMQKVIGSVAHGLNEDMDETAKTWKAFRQQNIDLQKVLGSDGTAGAIRDLTKVTTVYGVEGQQLANVMAGLHHGFGMAEEDVGRLADKVFAAGRHFNMGQEAVQAWPAIFETLNNELADFGRHAKPKDLDKLTTSIISLGGGLKKSLGMDAQSALELSRNVFTTIMGERKNILNMFRGKGGEFGDFAKQLAESGGGVGGVMEMMEADPLKFMETLRKMSMEAEKMGGTMGVSFQRLSQSVAQALGPDVTFAMKGNWDTVRSSIAEVPKVLKGSEGAFTSFAKKAHSTGRTAQERWELMVGRMETRLMRLSGPMRKKWVKDMQKGFGSTIGTIENMAKKGGPVGELTQRLLLVKDVGISALLPAFGKLTPLFGGLATSMLPVLTALGAMGLSFGSLGKMALGGGALYGLFYLLKNGPEKSIKALKNLGNTVWEFATSIFPQLKESIDVDKIFKTLSDVGTTVVKWIKVIVKKIDWGEVATTIGNVLMTVVTGLADVTGDILEAIFSSDNMEKGAKKAKLGKVFGGVLVEATWGALKFAQNTLVTISGKMWEYLFSAESAGDATKKILGVAGVLFAGITLMAIRSAGSIKGGFMRAIHGIKAGFKMLGRIGLLMGVIEASKQVSMRLERIADINESVLIPSFAKASQKGQEAFMGILNTLDKLAFGIPSKLGEALGLSSNSLEVFYHEMVGGVEMAIVHVVNFFRTGFGLVNDLLNIFGNAVTNVWDSIVFSAKSAWGTLEHGWVTLVNKLEGIMDSFWTGLEVGWMEMRHGFENAVGKITLTFAQLIEKSPVATDAMRDWAGLRLREEKTGDRARRQDEEKRILFKGFEEREKSRTEDVKSSEDVLNKKREDVNKSLTKIIGDISSDAQQTFKNLEGASRRWDVERDETHQSIEDQLKVSKKRTEWEEEVERKKELMRQKMEELKLKEEGKRGKGKKTSRIPTPAERGQAAGSVLPVGLTSEVTSLVGNNAMLARNVAEFTKNPIQLNLNISAKSGLKKMMRFDHGLESRSAL